MITVDGKVYKVGYKEAMYIGMGSREIIFASEDVERTAYYRDIISASTGRVCFHA